VSKGDKEMTKKEQKEQNKKNRTLVLFNTGTRIHADKRKPSRAKQKENLKKELTDNE
jgi:mRNA degradation ribonuclease J1/J2